MAYIIVIGGPTASGKSEFALRLATALSIEKKRRAVIINADSLQVYRGLPLLTAQPGAAARARVPHLLYEFLAARERCSAGIWLKQAEKAVREALAGDTTPIVTGGTGMYLKSLMHGLAAVPPVAPEVRARGAALLERLGHAAFHRELAGRDPLMGERLRPTDTQRILRAWEVLEQTGMSLADWQARHHRRIFPADAFAGFRILPPRERLYPQCDARFEAMMTQGALDEVKRLAALNLPPDAGALKALGVPELLAHLRGESTRAEAVALAQRATRRYAKRQLTWFRHQLPELRPLERADDAALDEAMRCL